jgi:hypothetical protein
MAAKIAILSSSLNLNDAGIGEARGMRSGAGWLRPIVSVALTQAEEEAFRNPVRMKDDAVRTVSSDGGALGMFALLHPAPGGVGRLERLYEPGKGYF